jgi:hypothetical protein
VTRSNHYVLTRDVTQVTLWELIQLFGENFTKAQPNSSARHLAAYPWAATLDQLVNRAGDQAREIFTVTLGDLFNTPVDGVKDAGS